MSGRSVEQLMITGPLGPVSARLFSPQGTGCFPAVLLLHEGAGISQPLLALAQRFADYGYVVLVPDLYSHDGVRKQLNEHDALRFLPLVKDPKPEELLAALPADERSRARRVLAWSKQRDTSSYFLDTQAAVAFLKTHKRVRPNAIASVGFSLGGRLSAQLAAAGTELAAGVIFYGSGPVETAQEVRYPLLGHYAERDPAITARVPELERRLRPLFRAFIYQGTEHGFFNEARPAYQRESSALAYQRTLVFLAERLTAA